MRYNHLDMLPEKAFNPVGKRMTLEGGGSGGGGSSTSYSTNLPEYAKPYYQELLKQTGLNVFTTDDSGKVTGMKGATNLPQQQAVGFTDAQLAAQQGIAGLQAPGGFATAAEGLGTGQSLGYGMAGAGIGRALDYQPGNISASTVSAPDLQQYQMAGPQNVTGTTAAGGTMQGATSSYAPDLQQYLMQAPDAVKAQLAPGASMRAATTSYSPQLQQYLMQAGKDVAAKDVSTQSFDQAAADKYMSPYAAAAIDPAVREARLQGDLQKQAGMLGSIGRGTFGGARQALLQAEQERGTQRNIADIRATGMEKAYQNAQAQFQADQARQLQAQQANQQAGMQAALANQQAGLTAGQQNLQAQLATQQLGTQTGTQLALANLTNEQQANVQNMAAELQTQGLNADQAMKAALANQQAQLTTGQQNLQSQLATQQLGAQTGTQMALANLTNQQQANVQNLAAQLQTQGLNADQALKAALANQQAQLTTGQQNLAAQLGIQQLGAGQNLQAQQLNQAAGLQAAQLNQQGQQYAAGLGKDIGLAGLQAGITSSAQQAQVATDKQVADLQRLAAQATSGAEQQALLQKIEDVKYQNAMAQENYQKQQLQFYSDILRGNAGALGSTAVQYAPAPSAAAQVGSLGLGALGLSKAFGS